MKCQNCKTNEAFFVVHLEPGKDIMLCLECKPDYIRKFVCERDGAKDIDEWANKMTAQGHPGNWWPEYPNWRPLDVTPLPAWHRY